MTHSSRFSADRAARISCSSGLERISASSFQVKDVAGGELIFIGEASGERVTICSNLGAVILWRPSLCTSRICLSAATPHTTLQVAA